MNELEITDSIPNANFVIIWQVAMIELGIC